MASPAVYYNNTLIEQRADPHIVKHTDGNYYFTATVPAYDRVILRSAPTIQDLQTAEEVTIWTRKESGPGSGQVWAPELHYIDGKWYIYVALGVEGEWRIRANVLEGTGDNPLTAVWEEKGIVETDWDTFSLDMSFFEVNGERYLIWAQDDPTWGDSNTSLMLARASNPWTIVKPAVAISRPDLAWERIGHNVNEGAYAIIRDGRIYITYSASATDHNYCMGLLSASIDSDLLDVASWTKAPEPVFLSNEATEQWGPGHSSFTTSEDGLSDLLVYHDRGYRDIDGDPLNDPNRRTRVQKVYWDANGPVLGVPVPEGLTPVRLRSLLSETLFVRQNGEDAATELSDGAPLVETQFRLEDQGDGTVLIETTSSPGRYLVRESSGLRVGGQGEVTEFVKVAGLADEEGISLAVKGEDDVYVVAGEKGEVSLGEAGDESQRGGATFYLE
jgi:GH43 family beta-xylosidase